jgi:DHA1 family bicyclomycin/chloramphenicol resistance-like MFS transporter
VSARRAVPLGLATLLASLAMVSPFAIDTFFPSMRAMRAEFGVSELAIQQTLTAYLIPYAITSLLHGPLSDALGRRVVVLWCIGLFTLASVLCALAPDFATLLACRAMQGATAGAGWTVGRAVIRDLYEGPEAQRLMSAVTIIFSLAPAIAPVVGGWIHVGYGWRAVFWLLAVLGLALVLACYRLLPETHPPERRVPLHAGKLASASWRILRDTRFLLLTLCGSLHFVAVMIYIGSAPAIVLDLWGLRETQFAQLFVPVIGGFSLGAVLSGRIAGRLSPSRQIFAGLLLSGAMAAGSLLLNLAWGAPPRLLQQLGMFGTSLGVQLVFPPLTLQVLDLYPAWRGSVASVQSFVQLSIGSAVMGVVAPAVDGSMAGIVGVSAAAIAAALGLAALARRNGTLAP